MPVNAQTPVKDRDTPISLRMIELVTLVLEHCHIAQHREPMRETLRYEELTVIILRQLHSHVLPVSRRTLTNINRHVKHTPLNATHQLRLRERRTLEMQTTHHAPR